MHAADVVAAALVGNALGIVVERQSFEPFAQVASTCSSLEKW